LQDFPELSPPVHPANHELPLLQHAWKLNRLHSLSSLSLIGQKIDAQDWHALIGIGSRLTVRAADAAACWFGFSKL
jgi:hypothetical protein